MPCLKTQKLSETQNSTLVAAVAMNRAVIAMNRETRAAQPKFAGAAINRHVWIISVRHSKKYLC